MCLQRVGQFCTFDRGRQSSRLDVSFRAKTRKFHPPMLRLFRLPDARDSILIVSSYLLPSSPHSRSQSTCRNLLNRSISFWPRQTFSPLPDRARAIECGRVEHQLPVTSARNKYVTTYRGHVLHNHKIRVTPYYLCEPRSLGEDLFIGSLTRIPNRRRIGMDRIVTGFSNTLCMYNAIISPFPPIVQSPLTQDACAIVSNLQLKCDNSSV